MWQESKFQLSKFLREDKEHGAELAASLKKVADAGKLPGPGVLSAHRRR